MKQKNNSKEGKSMNLTRIISAIIGFPLVALLLIFGNSYIIDIAFAVVAIISIYEYFNAFKDKYKTVQWLGYLCAILIAFIHVIPIEFVSKLSIIIMPVILAILFMHVIISNMKINVSDIAITAFGIFYIIGFLSFIPLLYGHENGKILVWYILFAAWGSDTFAYVVGRKFGKHKLSKISPKKSVEGAIGGAVGAVILSLIYTYFINTYADVSISYFAIAGISLLLSILSQLGDFAASTIKRFVDIKDFGNLIPGHGGMLDRIDSIIFIAPFAYILLTII